MIYAVIIIFQGQGHLKNNSFCILLLSIYLLFTVFNIIINMLKVHK